MDTMALFEKFAFPVAVAAWALWQSKQHEDFLQSTLTTTLKENTEATNRLSDLIKKMMSYINKQNVSRETLEKGESEDEI